LIFVTYSVVIFSIIVQRLTMEKLATKLPYLKQWTH